MYTTVRTHSKVVCPEKKGLWTGGGSMRFLSISYPAVASGSAPPTYVVYSLYMLILPLDAKE